MLIVCYGSSNNQRWANNWQILPQTHASTYWNLYVLQEEEKKMRGRRAIEREKNSEPIFDMLKIELIIP